MRGELRPGGQSIFHRGLGSLQNGGNIKADSQSAWLFFAIAFGISRLFWLPAAIVAQQIVDTPWVLLLYLGGIQPPVSAITPTYGSGDRKSVRACWQRAFDPRRIGGSWYLVVLLARPFLVAQLAWAA